MRHRIEPQVFAGIAFVAKLVKCATVENSSRSLSCRQYPEPTALFELILLAGQSHNSKSLTLKSKVQANWPVHSLDKAAVLWSGGQSSTFERCYRNPDGHPPGEFVIWIVPPGQTGDVVSRRRESVMLYER